MEKTTLFIADIFRSIQGEGPRIGTPSIFLRLGVCNLQCTWCDTPYTWKKGVTDYTQQTIEQIKRQVANLQKGTNIQNLVITGGEPLLQQAQLAKLLREPIFQKMEIEFETNGSIPLMEEFSTWLKDVPSVAFNISPKLADSGNRSYKVQHYPNAILKFVYVSQKSEKLISEFLQSYKQEEFSNLPPIYIMPEGTSVKAMSEKYEDITKYCLKNGFKFTPRLHIYLFGNTRAT